MKALYPPLSYALFIAISIAVLSLILISINGFVEGLEKNYAYKSLDYVAESIKNEILRMYSTGAECKFQLFLPEEIVRKKYMIELSQNNLTVSLSFKGENMEVKRFINITATLNGSSYIPASIEMRKSSGNIFIELVK